MTRTGWHTWLGGMFGSRTKTSRRRTTFKARLEMLESRLVPVSTLSAKGVTIDAREGASFNGTVATFTDSDPSAVTAAFTATINWGDGTPTVTVTGTAGPNGQIIADPSVPGQFDVQGTHTYAEEGHFNVTVTITDTLGGGSASTTFYTQTNLVTDSQTVLASLGFAPAAHTDPNLANPWGIAFSPSGSPFWVADNGRGVSTLYDGSGNPQALVVTIPASTNTGATTPAPVTGIVFNGSTTDFNVAGPGSAAHFIFATEDGTIAGWNSGTTAVLKVDNADFVNGPVYKGLAIGNNGTGNFLYATNFRSGTIDVFNATFAKITLGTGGFGTFADPTLPAGFAPFGIQTIGGQLFVTYARQNAARHDDVAGPGNGFVDVFDLSGNFVRRLASNGTLNSPWGLALAPATFGPFAGDLLVGNFGDGRVNAFSPTTGAFLGQLSDQHNQPITIDGLWGLTFGNNGAGGNAGTLYFTAGINDEVDGLFGSLTLNVTSQADVADAALLPGSATGSATGFSGAGGTNTSTTAGSANAALTAFKAAIGGVNNGAVASPQSGGFRVITWDGVALDGTDFGGDSTVIDPGHVVGIPRNRFQNVGVSFEQVYAVSGPASATDASTFSTVNPTVTNLFRAFSPTKTFAMFNDNTIDFSFVLASNPGTAPVAATTRGFGAIFLNVQTPNTTSIEYFNGNTSLGKFFAPVGGPGQAEFLGELFNSPIVTRVTLTLGTDVLFSFDGATFHAGPQANDPANGHNLVVTDDFAYAEPVVVTSGQTAVSATAFKSFTGAVATFTDLDPGGTTTDYTATINWGDGRQSAGTITALGGGHFSVSGTHTFTQAGTFHVSVLVQDLGGSAVTIDNTATVASATSLGFGLSATDQQIYKDTFDTNGKALSDWTLTSPGQFSSFVVGSADASAEPIVFALRSTDHQVYFARFTAGGSLITPWALVAPGQFTSLAVGAIGTAGTTPIVFGVGADQQAYAAVFTSSGVLGHGWFMVAPGLFTSLTASHFGAAGNPELFGVGTNNQAYAARLDTNGSLVNGFFLVAPGLFSSLAVADRGGGTQELLGVGLDHHAYGATLDANGNLAAGWFATAAGNFMALTAVQLSSGNVGAYALGTDQQLYTGVFSASSGAQTSGWLRPAPGLFTNLAAHVNAAGIAQVLAVDSFFGSIFSAVFDANNMLLSGFMPTAAGGFTLARLAP